MNGHERTIQSMTREKRAYAADGFRTKLEALFWCYMTAQNKAGREAFMQDSDSAQQIQTMQCHER